MEPSINHIHELVCLYPPPPPFIDKETKASWLRKGHLGEWSKRLANSTGTQIRPRRRAKGKADPSSLHHRQLVSWKELGTCGPGASIDCHYPRGRRGPRAQAVLISFTWSNPRPARWCEWRAAMLWHRGGETGRWEQGGRGRGFCIELEGEPVLGEGSPQS